MSDQATEQSPLEQLAGALVGTPGPEEETREEGQETESVSEQTGQAEPQETQPEVVQKFSIRTKGENGEDVDQEVTLDELRSGYLRQSDYTRKTERVAREREQFQQQAGQAIAGELTRQRGELEKMQAMVWQSVAPELQNIDWPKLAQEDPAQWAALQAKAQQFHQVMASLDQRLTEVRNAQSHQAEAQRVEYLKRSAEMLKADGFTNETYQASLKTGREYGFSSEEMNALMDPRWIQVLRDATKYREIGKTGKPLADKKVAEAPPVVKPGAAAPNRREAATEEARARLKKSGSVRDLAAAMRSMGL